ncbi:MAG: hypothetical protein JO227_00445, partial [Acetobacteraceae bacterium]|nr:hypothetical protein [Acetobacteraceae bacterium]
MSAFFSPALHFLPDSFLIQRQDLVGRYVANNQFLQGLIRHGKLEEIYLYLGARGIAEADLESLARELGTTIPIHAIQPHQV